MESWDLYCHCIDTSGQSGRAAAAFVDNVLQYHLAQRSQTVLLQGSETKARVMKPGPLSVSHRTVHIIVPKYNYRYPEAYCLLEHDAY